MAGHGVSPGGGEGIREANVRIGESADRAGKSKPDPPDEPDDAGHFQTRSLQRLNVVCRTGD
eukprot:COSAG01_NODE_40743_length_460_cov_0.761773_1_plen_61_part_10